MSEEEARKAIGRAGELLAEQGWTQGNFADDDGTMCMDGALDVVLMMKRAAVQ